MMKGAGGVAEALFFPQQKPFSCYIKNSIGLLVGLGLQLTLPATTEILSRDNDVNPGRIIFPCVV